MNTDDASPTIMIIQINGKTFRAMLHTYFVSSPRRSRKLPDTRRRNVSLIVAKPKKRNLFNNDGDWLPIGSVLDEYFHCPLGVFSAKSNKKAFRTKPFLNYYCQRWYVYEGTTFFLNNIKDAHHFPKAYQMHFKNISCAQSTLEMILWYISRRLDDRLRKRSKTIHVIKKEFTDVTKTFGSSLCVRLKITRQIAHIFLPSKLYIV